MTQAGFGAFGKMPSVGDFLRLNANQAFVQVWDDWIQRSMLACASAAGARWDAMYMSAPIWRFCLTANLAGPQKIIGVLMPSVDRVGRRFPLTLMAPMHAEGSALLTHFRETNLFRQLETLALRSLEDDMNRSRLNDALTRIPPPSRRSHALVRGQSGTMVLTQGEGLSDVLPDLAAGLIAKQYRTPSIWSTEIGGVPRLMVCEGLPVGANVQGLFDLHAAIWTEARPL